MASLAEKRMPEAEQEPVEVTSADQPQARPEELRLLEALLFASAQRSHVASANYSFQFHRATLYASEFKDFSLAGRSGLQVGITIPFGRRDSVNITGTSDGDVQMQAQRSAALVGEWGYNGYVSSGSSNHAFGQAQYKSHVGLITGGVDQSAGATSVRLVRGYTCRAACRKPPR